MTQTATLLDAARAAPLDRSGVGGLVDAARSAPAADVLAALGAALDAHEADAATALALAAAAAGVPLPGAEVVRLAPIVPTPTVLAALVARTDGDPAEVLCDAVESRKLGWDESAFALVLAVALLEGRDPPERLAGQVRLLAREDLTEEEGLLIGVAAAELDDPGVAEVAGPWIARAPAEVRREVLAGLRADAATAPLETLPDGEPLAGEEAGFTVRRPVAKVGRNAPCPCGSGKKYKRCCQKKDAARLADPSPVPGVTMAEYRQSPERYLTREALADMDEAEMARLEPGPLPSGHLELLVDRLAGLGYLAEAERALEALAARAGARDDPDSELLDDLRAHLVIAAVRARDAARARRWLKRIDHPDAAEGPLAVEVELLAPKKDSLERIERVAHAAHAEGPKSPLLVDLAYCLLDHFPALGIAVARGAIHRERPLDSEVLVEEIERARDHLGLPPGDPALDRFDELLASDVEGRLAGRRSADGALDGAADELRGRLQDAAGRAAALEEQLAARERQLAEREGELAALAGGRRPAGRDDAEADRLKHKVDELKGLIAERNDERSQLRRELADMAHRLEQEADDDEGRGGAAETAGDDGVDEAEAPLEGGGKRPPVVPVFAPGAEKAVRDAQPALARAALRAVANLAAGEDAAWGGVKRLQALPDVLSVRVGIHFRLLLRDDLEARRLEVVDLINRKDLDKTIRRLA